MKIEKKGKLYYHEYSFHGFDSYTKCVKHWLFCKGQQEYYAQHGTKGEF